MLSLIFQNQSFTKYVIATGADMHELTPVGAFQYWNRLETLYEQIKKNCLYP